MANVAGQTRQHRGRQQAATAQFKRGPTLVAQIAILAILAQQQPTNMYAEKVTEALDDTAIVTGMLYIGCVPTQVLFDSGCTHSFISYTHRQDWRSDGELRTFVSVTPAGRVITIGECVLNITVKIQQQKLVVHLTLFRMMEFNMIFVMNWMSTQGALIDFQRMIVTFRHRRHRSFF